MIASKAARMVLAASGKQLVDFGLRRAHSLEAGLLAARASYIAGFAGTATVLAEKLFDIPTFGTMAHSFIQVHDDESEAFENFARARPKNLTLLIDTYDTEAAARKIVALAPRLEASGITIRAVRIDSGNVIILSRKVRRILDQGGLRDVAIFASGGIDESRLASIARARAPITGFGIGTNLVTSSDAPALDCAYKLQEYADLPRRKLSAGKATWPGRKQVWRRFGSDGRMSDDILSLDGDHQPGRPLIQQVMEAGRRIGQSPILTEIRRHAGCELERLPQSLRRLGPGRRYRVRVARALRDLAAEVDRRVKR
jgi:nicotinate phosphoribosyltransferase